MTRLPKVFSRLERVASDTGREGTDQLRKEKAGVLPKLWHRPLQFDPLKPLSDNIPMPRSTPTARRKPSSKALVARVDRSGPSRAKLRRLVKRHPAPQEWIDQDTSSSTNGRKKRG